MQEDADANTDAGTDADADADADTDADAKTDADVDARAHARAATDAHARACAFSPKAYNDLMEQINALFKQQRTEIMEKTGFRGLMKRWS